MTNQNGDDKFREDDDSRLTAHALGQLTGDELAAMKAKLAAAADAALEHEVRMTKALGAALTIAKNNEPLPATSSTLCKTIEDRFAEPVSRNTDAVELKKADSRKPQRRFVFVGWGAAA